MISNPPPWPNNCRCAVAITFDMDADSLVHLEQPTDSTDRINAISLLHYGPRIAVDRILSTYRRLGLQQTFFVPGWCVERYPEVVRRMVDGGHEIGHHGYLHENPRDFDRQGQADLIDRGIDAIFRVTGSRPMGYRAPLYNYSGVTTDLLIERDFSYDASLMGDDVPYILKTASGQIVELPTHWGCDDWPPFAYIDDLNYRMPIRAPSDGLRGFVEEFDAAYKWGGLFVPVWHPFVTGRLARWTQVDNWLTLLVERGDVWITTMSNIANHIWGLQKDGTYEPRIDTLPYYKEPIST